MIRKSLSSFQVVLPLLSQEYNLKLLALLNLTIRILTKTFPCSLSVGNSKCISVRNILSFSETKILLFPTYFRLFKTSDLENFLTLTICFSPTYHCNLFLSTIASVHYIVYQKRRFQNKFC